MTFHIAAIVEGESESLCIQILLKRVWKAFVLPKCGEPVNVLEPFRSPRASLVKEDDPLLVKRVEEASRRLKQYMRAPGDSGLILVLLDADDDCPLLLAPRLLARARAARPDMDVDCVLAKRELENWFKAAAESLAGVQGFPTPCPHRPTPRKAQGTAG